MENILLNEKITKYVRLNKEVDSINEELKSLKEDILSLMGEEKEYTNGYAEVKLTPKQTFKYLNETEIIKWLENNGYEKFVTKSVTTTPFNNQLKKDPDAFKDLDSYISKNLSESFSCKSV